MMELLVLLEIANNFLLNEIEKLENHELNKIDVLYWRNSKINFDSLNELIVSLEKKQIMNF